jgi:hypothetical protein
MEFRARPEIGKGGQCCEDRGPCWNHPVKLKTFTKQGTLTGFTCKTGERSLFSLPKSISQQPRRGND